MTRFKFPVFLLAMGIAITGALAANVKPVESSKTFTVYYYSGNNTLSQIRDFSKYGTSSVSCPGGENSPCTMNWSGTAEEFQDHVESFPSVAQAISEAATLKN